MNRDTLSRPHILIIDDVPGNVEILGTVLTSDYEVRFATSGQEGLELARRFPTDLILLDVMMPEMDGYETFRRLQQDTVLAKIPVIFVTAVSETKAEITGLALGAADYIAKPINIGIARLRIRNLIEREMLKRKLELSLDASGQCFWELDLTNDDLKYDDKALLLLGMATDNAPHSLLAWLTRIHPDDRSAFMDGLQVARQAGDAVFNLEYRIEQRPGQWGWLHTHGRVVRRGADGLPELAVGTSMNITERQKNTAELERHRHHLAELVQQGTAALMETEARACHILNSSADGLYGSDTAGVITFINPAGCAMLGYSAEHLVGRVAHTVFHHSKADGAPYPAEQCPSRNALKLGLKVRVDNEVFWHADGHAVPVMYASYPMLQDGAIIGEVTSFVDVSVQRAAAQAREQALIVAENLARVRSEFLFNMSHELRTPLNGVLGFADIGARNAQNPEKARDAFAKIKTSGNRLLSVITDLLDFSSIDAGKLTIESKEFSLVAALNQASEVIRDRATAKRLDLRVELAPDLPHCCIGDPLRIGQVLSNLLSNAVKFTETGSIALSAAHQGAQLVFKVTDSGIGMSAEQLGLLFDPFQQADASATRRYGGTGLGLAIGKRIVELMGGEMRVESRLGVGSSVEFCLPYRPCS